MRSIIPSRPGRQEELDDHRSFFRKELESQIRTTAREFVERILADEVKTLCGEFFTRKGKENLAYRAGSETVFLNILGNKEKIRKPRVRRSGSEIQLESYSALRHDGDIEEVIFKLMVSGLTTRKFSECLEYVSSCLGISKSKVSCTFILESRSHFNRLNSQRFDGKTFFSQFIDGIHIADEVIVVILGVDQGGNKHFLSLVQGSSEHSEFVLSALRKLQDRDIQFTKRTLVISDGSKGIEKALRVYFGDKYDHQRCILHKMRNVSQCLPKEYQEQFKVQFKAIFQLNDYDKAKVSLQSLEEWLGNLSDSARNSFLEGRDLLLTCHRIGLPVKIRKTFLTTNPIDSAFSHPRFQLNRVKRWRKNRDMTMRWTGALLYSQELHFRRIKGYPVIPDFLKNYLNQENSLDLKTRSEEVSMSA